MSANTLRQKRFGTGHALSLVVKRSALLAFGLLILGFGPLRGAVIYTYDFPGSSATNGFAVNQTNLQPSNATFSDFTRQGGLLTSGESAQFGTKQWSLGATIDTTQFDTFSISAAPFAVLNLTQLSFDVTTDINGPGDFQVALYLNGSAIAYETSIDYHLQGTTTTITFDFTDLTTADNVTDATFKFFGWNAISSGGHLVLDNMATSGAIAVVPESETALLTTIICAVAIAAQHLSGIIAARRWRKNRP